MPNIYRTSFTRKLKAIFIKKGFIIKKTGIVQRQYKKKGFFIKKTGFDFEKKNPVRGKGFTQQKNRNCKCFENIKTGFI